MANVTYSAMLALVPDNTSGEISPADLRAIIESLQPSYASWSLTASAATVISAVDSFVLAGGTTAVDAHIRNFDHPAPFTLRYTGASPIFAAFSGQMSISSSAPNRLTKARFVKNGDPTGAESLNTESQRWVGSADIGSAALSGHFALEAGDTVALYLANGTAASNLTIVKSTVQVAAFVL